MKCDNGWPRCSSCKRNDKECVYGEKQSSGDRSAARAARIALKDGTVPSASAAGAGSTFVAVDASGSIGESYVAMDGFSYVPGRFEQLKVPPGSEGFFRDPVFEVAQLQHHSVTTFSYPLDMPLPDLPTQLSRTVSERSFDHVHCSPGIVSRVAAVDGIPDGPLDLATGPIYAPGEVAPRETSHITYDTADQWGTRTGDIRSIPSLPPERDRSFANTTNAPFQLPLPDDHTLRQQLFGEDVSKLSVDS